MAKNNLHTKKVTAVMPQLRSPQSVDMSLFNSQMSRLNSVKAQSGISKSAQNIINAMASNVQKSEKNAQSIINAAKKKEKKLEADLAKYRVLEKNAETDKSANQQLLEKRLSGENLFPVKKSASSETEKPKSELSDVSRQLFTADELNGTATVGIKDVNNLTDNDFQILRSRAQQRLATEIRRSSKKQDKTKIDALKSFISNIPAAGTEPTTAQSTPRNKSVNTALGNIQNRNTFQKTSSSEPVNTVLGNVQNRNTFPKQSNSTPVNTVLGNVQNRNTFPKTGDSIQEKIYKKYNINTDTFNNQDLSKWENDTGAFKDVTDNIKNKRGASQRFALMKTLFTGKGGEKGISDSTLRNEYRVLKAVADNNDRKNNFERSYSDNPTAKKITGNVRSALQSMSNSATFGLVNRLSDAGDKESFKRTGLSKDKLTKTTDVIKNNYGVAESIGNVAGDLFSLMASEAVVKGAVNAVKGVKGAIPGAKGVTQAGEIAKELNTAASFKNASAATKAPIKYALEKAAESGAAFGLQSFARTGIETGDLKQSAKSGTVSAVSGAAGSGVSSYVGSKLGKLAETYSEKAIAKKLAKNVGRTLDKTDISDLSEAKQYVDALYKNYGLKEYFYPRAFVNFATAGAFATASTATSIGMNKALYDNYNPTAKDTAKSIAEQTLVAFGFSTLHLFSEYGKLSAQNKTVVKDTVSQMEQCVNTMNDLKNSGNVSSQEYNALENAFKQRVKVMQNIVNSGEMVGSAKEQRELRNTLKMLNDYGEALKVIKDNGSYKILERDKPEEQPKTEKPSAVNVKYRDAANAETDLFSETPNGNTDTSAQTFAVQPFARRSGGRNIQYEQNSEPVTQPAAPTAEQSVEPRPFARRMSKQPTQDVSSDTEDFFPTPENAAVNDEQDFYPTPENSADVSNVRVPSAASENIPTAQINNSVPIPNVADVQPTENIPADNPINSVLERMFNERRAKDEAVIPPRQTVSATDISNDIKNQLMNGVNTISEITRNIGANIGQVNSTLFSMELNGEVKRKAENTYELTDTAAKNNQTDMIKSVSTDNSITSHKDNIASNDSNDILHTVENTIYPQFKENAVGLFEKEYGGNGFSGFADRLIENYKSDGDIGKGERAFFADNGESVTKLIADAVKNERGGGENISDRTYESVGSRNVKAFQYTYPQLKKYYSGIANELLGDINSTVKGEKTPIFAEDGSISGYAGTPRQTSSSIERIKDATGASYDKISDALNRIISDNGQENVALAKRIELVMDDMLSDGYTAFDGTEIPPNESYIAEKGEIEGYNDTAHKKRNLTAVENANPISATSETTDSAVSVGDDLSQNKSVVNNNSAQKSENNVADLSFKLKNSYHLLEKEPDLFEIDRDVVAEQSGKNITEKVYNYFKSIGGEADNPTLGKVEFTKSGAKSTVFHGVGHDKIRAVAAVKPVIENGVIVSKDTDWKNRGYDTYIIAGKGNIDNKKSIVGVIVKAYPNENNKGNKFYLHELIKIGADSDAVAKNSQTNVIESTPIDSDIISQKDGAVNNNSMQKSEKNSDVSPENILKMLSRGEKTSLVVIDKSTEISNGKNNANEKYSLDNHSDNSKWWSGDIKKATAEFSNQIDKWQRGEMKSSEHFDLGRTPAILQNIGADNLPLIMTQKVMNKITGGKHDIDLTELKKLPKNISEPVMVFKSATTPNAYVILTEMTDKNGDSIITAMHLNKQNGFNFVNRIASVYGKESVGNFVNKQVDAGNLLYIDKNKSQQWSQSRGLQLPKLADTITDNKNQEQLRSRGLQSPKLNTVLDNNNISQKSDVVNTHNTQKSEKYALSRPTFEKTDSKPKTSKKTVPVKSPRDIVRYISDTFNIPISTGNIGKGNANGVYKMPSQTIRTRITNDLPVISHELGHMLDDKYGLSNAKHINEALNYAYKLDPDFIDQYSGEEQDGEAIGQFVKSYLINPQKAKSGAAQFYKEFAEALSKEDMNALNQASKFIREYISADFMDRVHSNTVTNKELKESTPISEKAKTFYTKIVDDFDPIKHAVDFVEKVDGYQTGAKNAYTLAMNSKNAASISAFILREGMVDKDGNIVGKSFIECLSPIPEKQLDTFADYLLLKHSLEWLKPLDGSEPKRVFSDDTLQDVDEINKWISSIEKEFPHFKTAAKDIYEFQNNLMKYWCVDIGGMSESLFKALQERYPCYVPLYRAIIGGKRGIKSTFANQRIPINRAKGSGETIINVLESIMYNTEKFVKFGTHNQVMQNLADYADNVKGFGNFMEKVLPNKIPHVVDISAKIDKLKDVMSGLNDSDFSSLSEALDDILGSSVTDYTPVAIAGKQIVTVLRNGKAEYYQIHDKALFDAVANMTPKQLGTFAKLSRKILMPTNLLITQFNYLFGSKNVIRDFQTGYAHTQAYNTLAEYTAGYFRALGHIWKNSPEYKEYKAVGGGHMSNFSGCVDQLQKALHDIEQKDKGLATRMAYSIICHPIESIVSLNEIMETIPRLAEYEGMIKNGADRQAASLAAADITVNFNRSGEIGRELNSVFRFSNAAMQGMDKEIRTFTTGGKKNILKHIMRYVVSAILTTALIEAWNRKDKDSRKAWDNLANYQKNNFYCLYIGNGNFFKLPKAREVSVLNTLIERSIDYAFGNKDAFYQFGEYLGNTILPGYIPTTLNAKEALHDILGETALSGVADVAFNEDFKGSPIVSRSLENEAPKNQYNNKTSWLAYELGQLMNISPMKADHIIDNYGGVFGKINRSIGAKDSKQIDKSLGFKNTFITDSAYSTDTFNYMYDRRDKAEEKFKNDPTPENAALYQSYATGCSLITNSRKLIYDMPEDKQKAAQNKLIDTVKQYRKEHSKGDALIAKSFGKGLRYDSRGTDLPDNEISYKSNGKTVKQGLTFDQYMTFVKDYMNIADTKQKEVIRTDEYKKSDYDTKQKKLSKARSEAKKKAVQNIMSKIKE